MKETPEEIIAIVSRLVTQVADHVTGDRSSYPLLVAEVTEKALARYDIKASLMYGRSAWIEVLEDMSLVWAGNFCKSETEMPGFWVATSFGEVVDLCVSVAHRVSARQKLPVATKLCPPLLWSKEVPGFYRYEPIGIAEISELDPKHERFLSEVKSQVFEKLIPMGKLIEATQEKGFEFPNEPILCPGRKILDDSHQSFAHFDRAIGIKGIPKRPF